MFIPERGDICWLTFDPQAGHEQTKRRPALIISERAFNTLGLAVVCPITTSRPKHGFHVELPNTLLTKGCVMTEQIKSLDFVIRKAEFVEHSSTGFIQHIRAIIAQIV
jgi:mRNA interferase MazF